MGGSQIVAAGWLVAVENLGRRGSEQVVEVVWLTLGNAANTKRENEWRRLINKFPAEGSFWICMCITRRAARTRMSSHLPPVISGYSVVTVTVLLWVWARASSS